MRFRFLIRPLILLLQCSMAQCLCFTINVREPARLMNWRLVCGVSNERWKRLTHFYSCGTRPMTNIKRNAVRIRCALYVLYIVQKKQKKNERKQKELLNWNDRFANGKKHSSHHLHALDKRQLQMHRYEVECYMRCRWKRQSSITCGIQWAVWRIWLHKTIRQK